MITIRLMNDLTILTDNLKRLMAKTGLDSQVKLGRAAGVSQTNLSNVMRHAISPTLDTMSKLATPDVAEFLSLYARVSAEDRQTILRIAESLARPPQDAT